MRTGYECEGGLTPALIQDNAATTGWETQGDPRRPPQVAGGLAGRRQEMVFLCFPVTTRGVTQSPSIALQS